MNNKVYQDRTTREHMKQKALEAVASHFEAYYNNKFEEAMGENLPSIVHNARQAGKSIQLGWNMRGDKARTSWYGEKE